MQYRANIYRVFFTHYKINSLVNYCTVPNLKQGKHDDKTETNIYILQYVKYLTEQKILTSHANICGSNLLGAIPLPVL